MNKLQQPWEGTASPVPCLLGVSLARVTSFSWNSKIFSASRTASVPAGVESCPAHAGTNPAALVQMVSVVNSLGVLKRSGSAFSFFNFAFYIGV